MKEQNAELFDDYPRGTLLLRFTTCIQITNVRIGHDDASFLQSHLDFLLQKVLPAIHTPRKVTGDCNDYVGKGMNGGRILAVAPESSSFASQAWPLRCGLWFDRETSMGSQDIPNNPSWLTAIAP